MFQRGLTQRRKAAKEDGRRRRPAEKADRDPCRLARQVNEICERAARTVNQRLDPCQLVWQVNESGSDLDSSFGSAHFGCPEGAARGVNKPVDHDRNREPLSTSTFTQSSTKPNFVQVTQY